MDPGLIGCKGGSAYGTERGLNPPNPGEAIRTDPSPCLVQKSPTAVALRGEQELENGLNEKAHPFSSVKAKVGTFVGIRDGGFRKGFALLLDGIATPAMALRAVDDPLSGFLFAGGTVEGEIGGAA